MRKALFEALIKSTFSVRYRNSGGKTVSWRVEVTCDMAAFWQTKLPTVKWNWRSENQVSPVWECDTIKIGQRMIVLTVQWEWLSVRVRYDERAPVAAPTPSPPAHLLPLLAPSYPSLPVAYTAPFPPSSIPLFPHSPPPEPAMSLPPCATSSNTLMGSSWQYGKKHFL